MKISLPDNPFRGSPAPAWIAIGTLVVVVAIVVLAVSGGKSLTPGQSARTYIESVQGDTSEVVDAVRSVQLAVASATGAPKRTAAHELAQKAETAREEIDSVREGFAGAHHVVRLGAAQAEVLAATGALMSAMSSLEAYATDPSPAAAAQSTSALRTAVQEWDRGTDTIWRIAGLGHPPTL
jgi:hypothetical protein